MQHKYKLKYDINTESGEFSVKELKMAKVGGTDALIIISMLFPEGGSYSQDFFAIDGKNNGKDISSLDYFKAWMLMGVALAKRTDLDDMRRAIASAPMHDFLKLIEFKEEE